MTSKHIYSSDSPNAKDHIISAHAVDALTSVSGLIRSSRHQPKIHEIQSEVVDLLEPHLRENFGDQSRKIGPKESILIFSDNQGLLKPNDPLPKNPGRYTVIAPALPVSESLAARLPATAAFQPHNLQTIFSPSTQNVDFANIQRQIDNLIQDTDERIYKLEQENKMIVELKQKIVELEQKYDQLNEDSLPSRQSIFEQLQSLEEEVKGFRAISQNAAE